MNKSELIEKVAEKSGLSKADAGKAVKAALEAVVETVAGGQPVQIVGFGTFKVVARAARQGRNPQTGKEMRIAASKLPRFTAGKAFKAAVNVKKRRAPAKKAAA